ncbi:hypothetical protein [Flagellimonas taeanensis]|uniref:hypothetical protein n=1 Tax=Flagellimonas taeanensis TaxID=1005926 RepID=UPI001160C22D|nr:hypothetical protein [Allomuricauda taeanensis]
MDYYIEKVLIPLKAENPIFLSTLYKDICYILKDLDKKTDNDLLIENGDLVIENGDIKLTGYQTRLHDITIWLHSELILSVVRKHDNPKGFVKELNKVETEFLDKNQYTTEYKAELDKIKRSLINERKRNISDKSSWFKKHLDFDMLELKPNIFGIGLNINSLINKYREK